MVGMANTLTCNFTTFDLWILCRTNYRIDSNGLFGDLLLPLGPLADLHFAEIFNRSELYQLPTHKQKSDEEETIPIHLRGRILFGPDINYNYLSQRVESGASIKKTPITEEFNYEKFRSLYGDTAVPLFLIRDKIHLEVFATDNPPSPQPGDVLVSLVDA